MQFDHYQSRASQLAIYPNRGTLNGLLYTALGLGEAGEVQGKVKKILRDSSGQISPEARRAILDELGDVLWYVAMTAEELGSNIEEVAATNLAKLESRAERGTLSGSGDNR